MSTPAVSIIIPTYNRREQIVSCLETLVEQSLDRDSFEVIVASDGSTDGTPEAARAHGERLGLRLVVVEVDHGGPGHARNAGAQAASGRVLAFTDDDVRPSPRWLELGLRRFQEQRVGGVEGLTNAELGGESLYRLNLSNTDGGLYPTCNMFYLRQAFDEVGGFDERLVLAREDTDIALRVMDAGYRIVFEPRAAVVHRSHHTSVRLPLRIARQLPDSFLLWWKHPGRDRLRPRFYRSDAIKIGLVVAALLLGLLGHPALAVLAAAGFFALVGRTLGREVLLGRIGGPLRFAGLTAVYAAVPFANLYYSLCGLQRVRDARRAAGSSERS